jgi:hypothetical protein
MIVAHHWPHLCVALSSQSHSGRHLTVDIAFPQANRSIYMSSLVQSFLDKSQEQFLQSTRSHLRGIKKLTVFGSTNPSLSNSVEEHVLTPTTYTRPRWLALANGWCHLAQQLQHQNRHVEAWGLWDELQRTESQVIKQALGRTEYKRLRFIASIGMSLAYLHHVEFPPHTLVAPKQFEALGHLAEKAIREARNRARGNTQYAKVLALRYVACKPVLKNSTNPVSKFQCRCRLLRLESFRRKSNYTVSLGLSRSMLDLINRAEELSRNDEIVVEERSRMMRLGM